MTIGDDRRVTGEWRTSGGSTGQLAGTIDDKSQFDLDVTMFGAGEITRDDGTREIVGVERCSGSGRFTGTILRTGVIRLTAKRVRFDTPQKRTQGRECHDLVDVTWHLLPPDQAPQQAYSDIGARIDQVRGRMVITSVMKDSPAATAGIRAGDTIVAIDDVEVRGWQHADVLNALRGDAGAPVRLRIVRERNTLQFTVTRAVIAVN